MKAAARRAAAWARPRPGGAGLSVGAPNVSARGRAAQGHPAGGGAYALWGLFPLYWPLLAPTGAVEVLAHRVVWSLVVVAVLVRVLGAWPAGGRAAA